MEPENIVITDIPTSRILLGGKVTSIGHNLSREILRLRPDIHATIHVHDMRYCRISARAALLTWTSKPT
jgi:hypothetical protein